MMSKILKLQVRVFFSFKKDPQCKNSSNIINYSRNSRELPIRILFVTFFKLLPLKLNEAPNCSQWQWQKIIYSLIFIFYEILHKTLKKNYVVLIEFKKREFKKYKPE